MTLPASGTISLYQIADEFGVARSTPFPSGFYGKGGAPSSGALSFADFYGRSNFTLSASPTSLVANGYNQNVQCVVTSTIATTFTIAGTSPPRCQAVVESSTTVRITLTTPSGGTGSAIGTVNVAAANGDFLNIPFDGEWGGS
jgi:hypothetical protein